MACSRQIGGRTRWLRDQAVAFLRSSSAANVGEDKDSDKRQRDAIAAQLRSTERKGAKHSIRGRSTEVCLAPKREQDEVAPGAGPAAPRALLITSGLEQNGPLLRLTCRPEAGAASPIQSGHDKKAYKHKRVCETPASGPIRAA